MAAICLWSAMVAEASITYRYGVWRGLTPTQRHRLDEALGHPAVGEYLGRLQAALDAHQQPQADEAAQEATDAA